MRTEFRDALCIENTCGVFKEATRSSTYLCLGKQNILSDRKLPISKLKFANCSHLIFITNIKAPLIPDEASGDISLERRKPSTCNGLTGLSPLHFYSFGPSRHNWFLKNQNIQSYESVMYLQKMGKQANKTTSFNQLFFSSRSHTTTKYYNH